MTHPDVMWELVKDHQARLRVEAEHENRVRELLGRSGAVAPLVGAVRDLSGRHRRRWFGRRPVSGHVTAAPVR